MNMYVTMHADIIVAAKNYPSFSMSIHLPMSLYKKKIAPLSSDGPEVIEVDCCNVLLGRYFISHTD